MSYNMRNSSEYLTSINIKNLLKNENDDNMKYQNLRRILNAETLKQSYA